MPDSTTQIKSPTARLHEWAEGNGFRRGTAAGDLVHEMVDAALAEAVAGERAAIWTAIAQERGDGWDTVDRTDIVTIFNARSRP